MSQITMTQGLNQALDEAMAADPDVFMKAADPIPKLRQLMLDHQFSEEELDSITAEIDAEIDAAITKALDAPFPGPEELRRDVFEEEIAA